MSKIYPVYEACHTQLHDSHQCLLGRILTIADAAFSDREQRKAVKDLIKSEFNDAWNSDMRDIIVSQFKCVANIFEDDFGKEQKVSLGEPCDQTGKI